MLKAAVTKLPLVVVESVELGTHRIIFAVLTLSQKKFQPLISKASRKFRRL